MDVKNTKDLVFLMMEKMKAALNCILFEDNQEKLAERTYFYIGTILAGGVLYDWIKKICGKGLYIGIVGWNLPEKMAFLLYVFLLVSNMIWTVHIKHVKMNVITMLKLSMFPTFLYFFMRYLEYCKIVSIILLLGFAVYCVCQIGLVIYRYKSSLKQGKRWHVKKSIRYMMIYVFDVLEKMVMLGLICNASLWTWNTMQEETIALQGHNSIKVIESEDDLWGYNKEGLLLLKEDIFPLLSKQEQVDALQFFVDLECVYLGCNSVQVEIYEFENEMTLGSYNNEKRMIRISNSLLEEGSYACIPVLLHEVFHAYEHACVEEIDLELIDNTNLKLYETLSIWKEEMENYESAGSYSAKEQRIEYMTQSIEIYADMYSEKWSENYIEYIDGLEKEI